MAPPRQAERRNRAARCREMSRTMRRWIIEQSLSSNVGHVGSALSIVEIVAALWGGVLSDPGTDRPERDRFILSKGHAASALYATLAHRGFFPRAMLDTYCQDGALLAEHPHPDDAQIDSYMSGNICRCGTYPRIREAIHKAAGGSTS